MSIDFTSLLKHFPSLLCSDTCLKEFFVFLLLPEKIENIISKNSIKIIDWLSLLSVCFAFGRLALLLTYNGLLIVVSAPAFKHTVGGYAVRASALHLATFAFLRNQTVYLIGVTQRYRE